MLLATGINLDQGLFSDDGPIKSEGPVPALSVCPEFDDRRS